MYKPYNSLLDKITYITILSAIIAGSVLLLIFNCFNINIQNYIPACQLHALTGLYCPGCGGTRSFLFLIHCHVLKSIYYHPVVAYGFFPGLWFMITHTLYKIRLYLNKDTPHYVIPATKFNSIIHPITVRPLYIYIGVAILFAQWIAKNTALLLFHFVPIS